MPNRILKESIHQSEKLNELTDFQFRVWTNLITYVDDYGRGDARPAIIKGICFPLRDRVTNKDIEAALNALAGAGCVGLYEADGKPYLYFPNWESHQSVRNKRSKFPPPPNRPQELENICLQMQANVPVIQSNPNPNPNQESEKKADAFCGESGPPASPPVITLPLTDGSEYPVFQEQCHEWAGLYPAVDVIQQLRNMRGWLNANPTRRKTKRGINRFINNWLSKEQNQARPGVMRNPPRDADRQKTTREEVANLRKIYESMNHEH